jgi:circadian clock protein KaiB
MMEVRVSSRLPKYVEITGAKKKCLLEDSFFTSIDLLCWARNVRPCLALTRKRNPVKPIQVKKNGSSGKTRYEFSIYIARPTRRSDLALARLRTICDEAIPKKNYDIKVIDLSKNPELAKDHDIVATPAVYRTFPAPVLKSIGDLIDKDKALLGLNLKQIAAD